MKTLTRAFVACLSLFLSLSNSFAQTQTITGKINNGDNKEPVPAASVLIKGSTRGTYTDNHGNFKLTVQSFPVTLIISSVGFETQEFPVGSASTVISVDLKPASIVGREVVVSATRSQIRSLESPVSIERMSSSYIREVAAPSFYDAIANLKGVDVVTSSILFKTMGTRGFNGSGNVRMNQLVDGMDNQAPGLNFAVGNVIGITDLDVDNMELLEGASSALYGPGGMNGTLLINSKSPFKYQGLSFEVKGGGMHVDGSEHDPAPYYNISLRFAQKVSEKFAFKISSELVEAKDWIGTNYRN